MPQVKEAFSQYLAAGKAAIEKELGDLRTGFEKEGMDPAQAPNVRDMERRLAEDAGHLEALEADVYDHMYCYFRRYYSEGNPRGAGLQAGGVRHPP